MENFGYILGQLLLTMFIGFILMNLIFQWWFKSKDDDYDEEL